jgi:hypothetical protein
MAKFKVGDRVRVLRKQDGVTGTEHYKIGDIVTVMEDDNRIPWCGIDGRPMAAFSEDGLELVSHELNAGNVHSMLAQFSAQTFANGTAGTFVGYDWGTGDATFTTKPKKTIMNKINNFVRSIIDADTQALIEAGYVSECLNLTEDGEDELIAILFAERKAELVKLAKAKVAEAKKVK